MSQYRMFDWKSLLLLAHILICLRILWNALYKSTFLSPMVWKTTCICNILLLFFISQLSLQSLIFKIALLHIPIILIYSLKTLSIFIWRQAFCREFEFFLSSLIAQIKIGASLRTGFKQALPSLPDHFQSYFKEILQIILFSKSLPKEFCFQPVKQIITELKRADESPQCLKHLENLRYEQGVRTRFRRKAEAAVLQIRIQSFTLLLLYIGLFIFVISRYGLKYLGMLVLSFCLFSVGLILLSYCGRKMKWSI